MPITRYKSLMQSGRYQRKLINMKPAVTKHERQII